MVKEEKPSIEFDYLPVPSTITQLDLIFHQPQGLKLVTHSVGLVTHDFLRPQLHRLMKLVYNKIWTLSWAH